LAAFMTRPLEPRLAPSTMATMLRALKPRVSPSGSWPPHDPRPCVWAQERDAISLLVTKPTSRQTLYASLGMTPGYHYRIHPGQMTKTLPTALNLPPLIRCQIIISISASVMTSWGSCPMCWRLMHLTPQNLTRSRRCTMM
jgi:hypothetical protein